MLDEAFLESLGRFSYVYSWGVLHHTGALWQAVGNVLKHNVDSDGLFHTVLYNTTPTSPRWLKIKRLCNRSPHFLFPVLSRVYASLLLVKMMVRYRSPTRFLREYRQVRGMTFLRH